MNRKLITRDLFINLTSETSPIGHLGRLWLEFYHVLRHAKRITCSQSAEELGSRLISLSEAALSFRRYDLLDRVSDLIAEVPLLEGYKIAGLYYKQLCVQDLGKGDLEKAESLLGSVIESGDSRYRAKALTSLAAIRTTKKDYGGAINLYFDSLRAAKTDAFFDQVMIVGATRMIAFFKSMDGSHRSALQHLEHTMPVATMVRWQHPFAYYNYLNSLAVELLATGQWEAARRASSVAMTSPYAIAYPEWRETHDDIMLRTRRRSVVYMDVWPPVSRLTPKHKKVIVMPSPRPQSVQSDGVATEEPGRVIDFPVRETLEGKRDRMRKPIDPSQLASMSTEEKMLMCVDILMMISGDRRELESIFDDLPGDFRARALIELVMARALKNEELNRLLNRLTTGLDPVK